MTRLRFSKRMGAYSEGEEDSFSDDVAEQLCGLGYATKVEEVDPTAETVPAVTKIVDVSAPDASLKKKG